MPVPVDASEYLQHVSNISIALADSRRDTSPTSAVDPRHRLVQRRPHCHRRRCRTGSHILAPSIFLATHQSRPAAVTTSSTAKLSSATATLQRTNITFAEKVNPPPGPASIQSAERKMTSNTLKERDNPRRRRSSSLMYQEPPESLEQQSDQAALPNLNAQWVNAKGTCRYSRVGTSGFRSSTSWD